MVGALWKSCERTGFRTPSLEKISRVLDAINGCPSLDIRHPIDAQSLANCAAGFEKRSYSSLFKHCVGAIDGIAIEIQAPRSDDPAAGRNQQRLFSGSKLKY